ncbi:lysosomal cholesterol signaling protein [Onthophagus taurus]|uniref:lysosomal cholesterol signaling protein n=1 Tax=Onthophagus taurus TaxID=166361 RepID=UPI0039BE4294
MSESGAEIDNLYPALTQCFVIISCGYLAGRMNLISETEAKGINTFVGTFALPSLIFMSLAELDLTSVNWLFLLSVLISKGIVFFAVIIVTLLISRPLNFGRAGIFAIFCTQSNDFAIGYPIVVALYSLSHPEYASYLYLMAPISLAILNPIGFVLMEIHKRRNYGELSPVSINSESNGETGLLLSVENRKKFKLTVSVMKSIFLNPIILMTLLGIIGNLMFKHKVPVYLSEILKALGSAFSASALFLLGLRMVGKVHKLRGATLVVPGILIICKLLVLPIVTRQVINIFKPGSNETETTDLSTYGFLYGTFPAAPTVFVFATQYTIDIDLIASAMVACTFISAPLMFVSAKMISLPNGDSQDYVKQLESFMFDVSILGVICSIWVLLVFTLTKKLSKVPHKVTGCLVGAQLTSCLGAILWKTIGENNTVWVQYLQFMIFSVGVFSSRLWTAILSMVLLFLQCRSLCFVVKLLPWCYFIGFGFPVALSGLLLAYDKSSLPFEEHNPNFAYGVYQAIVAVSLLVFCFIATVGCLILHQRYRRRHERYLTLANDVAETFESNPTLCEAGSSLEGGGCCGGNTSTPVVVDIEDIDKKFKPKINSQRKRNNSISCATPSSGCGGGTPQNECQNILRRYQEPIDEDIEMIEEEPDTHDAQILRHVVLLILLLCSMFVGLSLCIWTLIMDRISGIYIELSFLDTTLNFGQSIIVFAVFGTDTKDIVLPLLKYWRKLWYGANTLILPSWDELSADTKHICDQFVTHHLVRCRDDIAEDKRWRLKVYRKVFSGARFVDWLLEYGLARDRGEAVNYARHLVEGKVLRHINGVYHFYDRNLLYTFN